MEQPNRNLFDLQLDQQSFAYFRETAKWAKFIAIIGFIFCAMMVVFALFAGTMFASMGAALGAGSAVSGGITVFYIVFAILWFFPCLYLYRFASQMQSAIENNEQVKLQNSLMNLKSYFRFMGILFIVILALYALAIIGGVIMGIS